MKEIRVYTATTHVGYGFPEDSLKQALEWEPQVIVAQGTSTDPGPYYLGSGESYTESLNVKRDLSLIITAAKSHRIPFICSVGGAGANIHLEKTLKLIAEIAREHQFSLRVAVISGEINKEWLKDKLAKGFTAKRLISLNRFSEELTTTNIDECSRITAQMGPEPIISALDLGVDGIITGRALDVSLIVALPLKQGYDTGLAFHMAKVLECGALAAEPGSGSDGLFGILRPDHFLVMPPNPKRKCTTVSVVAHSFYERDNPYREELPGGYLDVTKAIYEQHDDRTVMVKGSKFVPTAYSIKLEGAKLTGYRTICIAGIRDPMMITRFDLIATEALDIAKERLRNSGVMPEDYNVNFRVYGKDGVMGKNEPVKKPKVHELCLITDVVARNQKLANTVCATIRAILLHHGYSDRKTTAGNLAFPFSPSDIPLGPVYTFNIWHALSIDDPCEPFDRRLIEFS